MMENRINEEFKSKVWNALEKVAMEYPELNDEIHEQAMDQAIEYFMVHFYNR